MFTDGRSQSIIIIGSISIVIIVVAAVLTGLLSYFGIRICCFCYDGDSGEESNTHNDGTAAPTSSRHELLHDREECSGSNNSNKILHHPLAKEVSTIEVDSSVIGDRFRQGTQNRSVLETGRVRVFQEPDAFTAPDPNTQAPTDSPTDNRVEVTPSVSVSLPVPSRRSPLA